MFKVGGVKAPLATENLEVSIMFDDYELESIINGKMKITEKQRSNIIDHTLRFEECIYTRVELELMTDSVLAKEYRIVLYDYVIDQI